MNIKVTILCIHKVTDEKFPSWPGMSVNTFEKLLKYISKNFEVCLPDNVKENFKKKQLILTFDDGFEDFYINAFPLLKKYNLPSVLNVVLNCIKTDYQIWTQQLNDALDAYAKESKCFEIQIGEVNIEYSINIVNAENLAFEIFKKLLPLATEERELIVSNLEKNAPVKINRTKMMNLTQLKEISETGVLIGSHSLSHPNFKIEDSQTEFLKQELSESRVKLEKILNKPVEVFAFPNGMYSKLGIELAKEARYKYLLLVDNNTAEFKNKEEVKVLDRILIYSNNHYKNVFRIKNFHNKIRRWLK